MELTEHKIFYQVIDKKGNFFCLKWSDGYEEWTTPSGNPPNKFLFWYYDIRELKKKQDKILQEIRKHLN